MQSEQESQGLLDKLDHMILMKTVKASHTAQPGPVQSGCFPDAYAYLASHGADDNRLHPHRAQQAPFTYDVVPDEATYDGTYGFSTINTDSFVRGSHSNGDTPLTEPMLPEQDEEEELDDGMSGWCHPSAIDAILDDVRWYCLADPDLDWKIASEVDELWPELDPDPEPVCEEQDHPPYCPDYCGDSFHKPKPHHGYFAQA